MSQIGDFMEYIPAKTIVTHNKRPDYWFGCEYNMNIYRGCSHSCIYCDSRSDCYQDKNFHQVKVKEDALAIIRNDLRRKVKKGVVATGAMSDPYNPLEEKLCLTRNALELISAYGFGAAIDTKGILIKRDIDVLKEIKAHSPVIVKITITTLDDTLAKIIEPRAPTTSERLEALKMLSEEGIYAGVLLMPVLPFINDSKEDILNLLEALKAAKAKFIYPYFGLTLRDSQRAYFYNMLDKHFPSVKERYIETFGNKYKCPSPRSRALYSMFKAYAIRNNILYNMKDIIYSYKCAYENTQLSLF